MVLPIFLTSLLGNGLVNKGVQGLAQGGGFGLGYGFMVRAGYDLYGAIKDRLIGSLQQTRYSPDTALSMAGTGGLMGLKHNPENREPDTSTLNRMTSQQQDSLARKLGGKHKIPAYLQSRQKRTQQSTRPASQYKTIRPHVERWQTQAYNLKHGKYDRFLSNFGFNY